MSLLTVRNLSVDFHTKDGVVQAVKHLDFDVARGETLAILGESGSGKSVSVQAVMGLVPIPPGKVSADVLEYDGLDLTTASEAQLRDIRGPEISMIFQDPLTALNPVFPVGWQVAEMVRLHEDVSRKDAKEKAVELMERVKIPDARKRASQYPHQFSGGMRQRVMIAMALALNPKLLIADEPTTALDVTVQAQVMDLLKELQQDFGMALILITHDLGVAASVADRVMIMYAGTAVEKAAAPAFYREPRHPYARGLMDSVPRLHDPDTRLHDIQGQPPSLIDLPSGCAFHPRCPYVVDQCSRERPVLEDIGEGRQAACFRVNEIREGS